jgi:hypothetical protein
MSPEIPLTALPQLIQDRRAEAKVERTFPTKIWNDCVDILEKYGHNEDLNKPLAKKLENFFKKNLKFPETSNMRIIFHEFKIEDGNSLDVGVFSFGLNPREAQYIGIKVFELDSHNALVISNKDKKPEMWNFFTLDTQREANWEDLEDYSQVVDLFKANPPEQK